MKIVLAVLVTLYFNNHLLKGQVSDNETSGMYAIKKTSQRVVIDGVLDDESWEKAGEVRLNYFYRDGMPTSGPATTCKMLWDDEYIYASFFAKDQFLTATEKKRDGAPFEDDCGELFLTPLPVQDRMHFGFEVNLYKASNDFIFIYDYYPGSFASIKSYNPDFEVAFTMDGTLNDNSDIDKGWSMEMAIPLNLFFLVGPFSEVKAGTKWMFQLLRQNRDELTVGNRTSCTLFPCKDPVGDVHSPSSMGLLVFEE
ncbi:MAG: carbohydrate-binding family 9-like protein [Bacteroidota bacterium]